MVHRKTVCLSGMIFIITSLIGLLAGFVGGLLGVGGSTIIIPALIIYLSYTAQGYTGQSQHLLQAAAMICNVFIAAPSIYAHRRANAIMADVIVWLIPSALAGIFMGVAVSNSRYFARHNGKYLATGLAIFMAYVIVYNLIRFFSKTKLTDEYEKNPPPLPPWKIICVGVPMGLTAGLLGIGGGILCVPAQQLLLKLPLRRAIANSAVTIVFSAFFGAIYKNLTLPSHGLEVNSSLRLAAMLIPTAIIGSYLGGWLTHILPRQVLRIVFIVFMTAVCWRTLRHSLHAETPPPPAQIQVAEPDR